jgi:hypothetical protein
MKKATILFGAILVLLGLAALIHPRVAMPARRTEVQVLGQQLLVETRRIVTIPPILGGLLILAGAGLIFLGPRASATRT